MKNGYIAVFDSGIGGISLLNALVDAMPYERFLYFGDNDNAPYGNKNKAELLRLAINGVELLKGYEIKGLVLACNTLSTSCIKEISEYIGVKTFGVFPPVERCAFRGEKTLVLSFVLNKLYTFTKNGRMVKVGTNSFYVQNVLKYISEHFSEDIDTAILAERFSVSRSKLDRDFKHAIGATPKTFIESCRIANAKILLGSDRERKVSEISELCGFASDQYFYRFFKKHTGMTPAEYKKSIAIKRSK